MQQIRITSDKSQLDVNLIHSFLQSSYWAKGRSRAQVQKSIDHSHCFGVVLEGKQIGFARVVSDTVVFAYLMDFFILPEHQGNGYAQVLLHFIFADKALAGVQKWFLKTKDAHGLYERMGFQRLADPSLFMEKSF